MVKCKHLKNVIGEISYDVFRQIPVSTISDVIAKMLDFDIEYLL